MIENHGPTIADTGTCLLDLVYGQIIFLLDIQIPHIVWLSFSITGFYSVEELYIWANK